jgi:maleate cis-trans isomerase
MIIPSVNSMTEPQFNHFAPPGLGVHVARARVAGEWKRPLAAMADEIATSAKLLADVAPDLIVFHCTDTFRRGRSRSSSPSRPAGRLIFSAASWARR